jgi:hypothetical protein
MKVSMQFRSGYVSVILFTLVAGAQTVPVSDHVAENRRVDAAQQEYDKTKRLVEAGALPPVALEKLESTLQDARDEAVLGQTLYGSISVEELTDSQAEEMLAAAHRQVERQKEKVAEARKLVDAGVASRLSLTPFIEELDRRKRTVGLAESRARLLGELIEMAKTEEASAMDDPQEPVHTARSGKAMERYDGNGVFTTTHFHQIQTAFEKRFRKPLPVSARGGTALHRSLGFDHSGRVDVALTPDQKEGIWLRGFLETTRVPYYAFRRAIRGKATAAHIHIGPPSTRIVSAD